MEHVHDPCRNATAADGDEAKPVHAEYRGDGPSLTDGFLPSAGLGVRFRHRPSCERERPVWADVSRQLVGEAHEAGDGYGRGVPKQGLRSVHLSEGSVQDDAHPVCHSPCFSEVVRHPDEGRSVLGLNGEYGATYLLAEGGVQGRERLVEEQDRGACDDGASQGHAVGLAPGQAVGTACSEVLHVHGL
jgi:hypothetical protein